MKTLAALLRSIILPLMLGGALALVTAAVYWGLEALLTSYADHDRGLWEGGAVVMTSNGGFAIVRHVLKRVDARKNKLP